MTENGYITSGNAQLYFQQAGRGPDFVMLHAGVADHRQWTVAFDAFAADYRVLSYDQRGFGSSAPTAGEYRAIDDLEAVMQARDVQPPAIMMGCSMGGALAMDFTIAHPEAVAALVMVCSGPSGLKLDLPEPEIFSEIEAADQAGDLDRVCELETQIWFDGEGRGPEDVDAAQRALLYTMNHAALEHEAKGLGERQFDLRPPAHGRLGEIEVPVLVITGALDLPYTHAAAEFMCANLSRVEHVEMADTAHLPNMEHPAAFNTIVAEFLNEHLAAV